MFKTEIYVFNKRINLYEEFNDVKKATEFIKTLNPDFNTDIKEKSFYHTVGTVGDYKDKLIYIENRYVPIIIGVKHLYKDRDKLEYLKIEDKGYFVVFNRGKRNQKLYYTFKNKNKESVDFWDCKKLKPYTKNVNNALYVTMFGKKWLLRKLFEQLDEKA